MDDITTIFYVIVIILTLFGGLIGKNKKNAPVSPDKKKSATTKSFKNDQASSERTLGEGEVLKNTIPEYNTTFNQKKIIELKEEFEANEIVPESLEEIIQDEDDHRNTKIQWLMAEEEKSDDVWFNVDNWQQAIVVSEVLSKPKALQ